MKKRNSREAALKEQMIALLPRLRRFARNLAGSVDKGDDLMQAACERALTRLDQVSADIRLDSWLYRITYTRWIDTVRRGQIRKTYLKLIETNKTESGIHEDFGQRMATTLDIRKAVNTLPDEYRAALILVGIEGYSYAEAAKVLSVPVGTVASRVARARTMLSDFLNHDKRPTLISISKNQGIKK